MPPIIQVTKSHQKHFPLVVTLAEFGVFVLWWQNESFLRITLPAPAGPENRELFGVFLLDSIKDKVLLLKMIK